MLCLCLQHYPLYRTSDAECTGEDAAPHNERYQLFQERYDVLSQDASKKVRWRFYEVFEYNYNLIWDAMGKKITKISSVMKNISVVYLFR